MLELASKLGRLASGMSTDRTEMSAEVTRRLDREWEIALERVYGSQTVESGEPTKVIDVGVAD